MDSDTFTNEAKIVNAHEGKRLNVLGDNMTVKLTGADTNGAFIMVEQDNPPGTGIPMHVHENEDELFKILEGEMEFTVDGKTSLLKAGDLIFLPRKVPHTFKVVGNQNVKTILCVYPAGLEHMFYQLSDLPAGPPDIEKVMKICSEYGISFIH